MRGSGVVSDGSVLFWHLREQRLILSWDPEFTVGEDVGEAAINEALYALYDPHTRRLLHPRLLDRPCAEGLGILAALTREGLMGECYQRESLLRGLIMDGETGLKNVKFFLSNELEALQKLKQGQTPTGLRVLDAAYGWGDYAIFAHRVYGLPPLPSTLDEAKFLRMTQLQRQWVLTLFDERERWDMDVLNTIMAAANVLPLMRITDDYNPSLTELLTLWGDDEWAHRISHAAFTRTPLNRFPGFNKVRLALYCLGLTIDHEASTVDQVLRDAHRLDCVDGRLSEFFNLRLAHPDAPAEWCLDLA